MWMFVCLYEADKASRSGLFDTGSMPLDETVLEPITTNLSLIGNSRTLAFRVEC